MSADVIVAGAGYTGLSAALHLAERGARVVLVEAAEIGFGGSGRNVGLVNAGLWTPPDEVSARLGPERGRRLVEQLGAAPSLVFELVERHDIACEARRTGTLHCAPDRAGAAELAERADQWRALGAPVRLLGAAETAAEVGSNAFECALLDHRAGTIQPLAYAHGLAHAAVREGVRLYTRTPALAVSDDGRTVTVRTPAGRARADWVVVATESYSQHAWGGLSKSFVRLPYFNFATQPLPAEAKARILPNRRGIWDTRTVLSSLRMDAQGRLIFGGVGALRGSGLAVHESWARRTLRTMFPDLGPVAFEHGWHGVIGMTTDALPHFHRLGRRIVSIAGFNGRGIAPGTSFGRDLARLVSGEIGPADLAVAERPVRPAPFRSLRELAFEAGAQLVHVASGRAAPSPIFPFGSPV